MAQPNPSPTAGPARRSPAPIPQPLHAALVARIASHRTRAAVGALLALGFAEQSRLVARTHLAELHRAEDGAAVTVARGRAGDVLLLADRPLVELATLEVA